MNRLLILISIVQLLAINRTPCKGHDLWIETNTTEIRTNELVYVDFKLGNCSDGRRDFKTKGLVDKNETKVTAYLPSGRTVDLLDRLTSSSSDPSGGFWTSTFQVEESGTMWFAQSLDQVVLHDGAEMRGVVTGKAFVIGTSPKSNLTGVATDRALNLPVEFVLASSPFPSLEEKSGVRVQLLINSKPIAGAQVSFLPKGIDIDDEDTTRFETDTDTHGIATFYPAKPSLYLITARHITANTESSGPKDVYYSTSLTLRVSNRNRLKEQPN